MSVPSETNVTKTLIEVPYERYVKFKETSTLKMGAAVLPRC
jgi:hypothetical protein